MSTQEQSVTSLLENAEFANHAEPADHAVPADHAQPAPAATLQEIGGREGPEPTRFGDWELRGRCIDF
jgi:hypothetical protein